MTTSISPVGIDDLDGYIGRASLDVETLFRARGLDPGRLANLRMLSKSVNLPCEDPVTNGVNAASPILQRLGQEHREDIDVLIVGTESGLDFGKPISTYIQDVLGLAPTCRSFEVKHACYGGTAALQTAAAMIATSTNPQAKALVVCTDAAARIDIDSYWEPSQGAGAVAMLVTRDPRILQIDLGSSGYYSYHVMDTLRPRPEVEAGDSDLSLLSYLKCLDESFSMYLRRNPRASLSSFDRLLLHVPFAGMVVGAHRTLLRKHGNVTRDQVSAHFETRVASSLLLSQQVGNTYGASLYMALCSMLANGSPKAGERVGLFSYGSGCGSEFYSGTLGLGASQATGPASIKSAVAARTELDMGTYEKISQMSEDRFSGVESALMDTGPYQELFDGCFAGTGLAMLESIQGYERHYRFA